MWTDISKSLLEFLRLAPRYLIAVATICALLLFSSNALQHTLGITDFVESNRQWIGLALICSLGIWVMAILAAASEWVKRFWSKRRFQQRIIERLANLTEPEKQILRYYFAKDTRGNKLRLESGDVQALTKAGIIYRSASLGSVLDGFAHNISDFAWAYLRENLHLLDGETDTYHTDERGRFW